MNWKRLLAPTPVGRQMSTAVISPVFGRNCVKSANEDSRSFVRSFVCSFVVALVCACGRSYNPSAFIHTVLALLVDCVLTPLLSCPLLLASLDLQPAIITLLIGAI